MKTKAISLTNYDQRPQLRGKQQSFGCKHCDEIQKFLVKEGKCTVSQAQQYLSMKFNSPLFKTKKYNLDLKTPGNPIKHTDEAGKFLDLLKKDNEFLNRIVMIIKGSFE